MFAEENCNTGRQPEFDLAKAVAIVFMVCIHVYEQLAGLAGTAIEDMTSFDVLLQFLAGPLVAPLYMIAMGVGIIYSRQQEPWQLLRRGICLLFLAYLLNGMRDAFPYYLRNEIVDGSFYYWLLNVEVLHLAGLSFILLSLLWSLKLNVWLIGLAALGLQQYGISLAETYGFASGIDRCLYGLLFYTGAESCFPLLLWFVYPAAGLILGRILQRVADLDAFYCRLTLIAAGLLAAFCVAMQRTEHELYEFFTLANFSYYQQDELSFIFSLLVVLLELCLLHWLLKLNLPDMVMSLAGFMSRHLTKIYFLQWLLIEWSMREVYVAKDEVISYGLKCLLAAMLLVKLYDLVSNSAKAPPLTDK